MVQEWKSKHGAQFAMFGFVLLLNNEDKIYIFVLATNYNAYYICIIINIQQAKKIKFQYFQKRVTRKI